MVHQFTKLVPTDPLAKASYFPTAFSVVSYGIPLEMTYFEFIHTACHLANQECKYALCTEHPQCTLRVARRAFSAYECSIVFVG